MVDLTVRTIQMKKGVKVRFLLVGSSGSRGTRGSCPPPGPVKISHKKDGRRRRVHRFHVSRPPYLATGSATGWIVHILLYFLACSL